MTAAQSKIRSPRNALLGKIAIAVKQLGLPDESLRDILHRRYGVRSRTQLTEAQLGELVEHFKTLGFREAAPQAQGRKAGRRTKADHPEARKMRALWLTLWHLGAVRDPSETALIAFAKRVTGGKLAGISAIQWIKGEQATAVIEALKDWAVREGVDWAPYDTPLGPAHAPRARVLEAQARRAKALGVDTAAIQEAMRDLGPVFETSSQTFDAAIQAMGVLIREAQGDNRDG